MRKRILFSMIALMAMVAMLAAPMAVMAAEVTIDDGDTFEKTYDLDTYGWISWNWDVSGFDSVDFWIEDSDGLRYKEEYDSTSEYYDIFTATEAGEYTLVWSNDGSTPITVEYDVDTFGVNTPEEMVSGLVWTAAIIGIIILVVIILVVVLVVKSGKKAPDAQQQQQQQYQQQQYYQQQQQYQQPQQQYPQQPYPQQPQDPNQPQPPQQQYYQPPQQQPPQQPPQQQQQQPWQRKPPEQ